MSNASLEYKLTITAESDLLIGASGGHGTIIDKDTVFDDFGLPYIPSKRIKGIIKDSFEEVISLYGDSQDLINKTFGKKGSNEFHIYEADDFFLTNYHDLCKLILKEGKNLLPDMVKSFFTYTRTQTAIDEDGIAKEHSLRTYRVLKRILPNKDILKFTGTIKIPVDSKDYVEKALKNADRLGTKRSRGPGHIRIDFEEPAMLNNTELKDFDKIIKSNDKEIFCLNIRLNNLQKVLIQTTGSDENMVSSLKYIRGANIMGMLIQQFLKKFKKNESFYDVFFRGKLRFSDALPLVEFENKVIEAFPCPMFIEKDETQKLVNSWNSQARSKEISGFLAFSKDVDNNDIAIHTDVNTKLSLHHTRNKDTGKVELVYNYQAITPYQVFSATISGAKGYLEEIKNLLTGSKKVKIGASLTAEYGLCSIEMGEIYPFEIPELQANGEVIMVLVSDTIIYNQNLCASTSCLDLLSYMGNSPIFISKMSKVKIIQVENFIKVWQSKKPSDIAIKAGTCFLLSSLPDNWKDLLSNGIGERTHEGFGRVAFFPKNFDFKQVAGNNDIQIENPDNRLFEYIKKWNENEITKKENLFQAMLDAETFAGEEMGNLPRQLLEILLIETGSITQNLALLSSTGKNKMEHFYNSRNVNLKEYIKSIDAEELDNNLKREKLREFLTHLQIMNKLA